MRSNDFNSISPLYDRLARLVFGSAIRNVQTEFIHLIKSYSKILILGGGTGWIIKEVINAQSNVEIYYIEKSQRMLDLARTHVTQEIQSQVHFINVPFEEWKCHEDFDFVLCNFFLDVFSEQKLKREIIPLLKNVMTPSSKLFVADFQKNKYGINLLWQQPLLWLMHGFFRVFTKLESTKLCDLNLVLRTSGFQVVNQQDYYRGMIFSKVFSPV